LGVVKKGNLEDFSENGRGDFPLSKREFTAALTITFISNLGNLKRTIIVYEKQNVQKKKIRIPDTNNETDN